MPGVFAVASGGTSTSWHNAGRWWPIFRDDSVSVSVEVPTATPGVSAAGAAPNRVALRSLRSRPATPAGEIEKESRTS